jgi:hypothetical protein
MPPMVYLAVAGLITLLFPLALLFTRRRVRRSRQHVIADLDRSFFAASPDNVAALDFVKSKYSVDKNGRNDDDDETAISLLTSALPYLGLCYAGFILLVSPIETLLQGATAARSLLMPTFFWGDSLTSGREDLQRMALIISIGFLGAYLFTARVLLRAVQNYELSQITFLRCASHLAFGIISSVILFRSLYHVDGVCNFMQLTLASGCGRTGGEAAVGLGLWLGLAFFCGYIPDLGVGTLTRYLRINILKQADGEVIKKFRVMPVEVIDGIDYDVRYRLEEAGIYDVQNLATANPLLLYVETPFGLYQTFDWVLQAQLCLVTEPERFIALKLHNIRTILDLERAVIGTDAPERYVQMIGAILFSDPATRGPIENSPGLLDVESVQHAVMVMLDDLHVHRLRELWRHIYVQLTPNGVGPWLYREHP